MKSAAVILLSAASVAQAYLPVPWYDVNNAANQRPPPRKDIQNTNNEEYYLFILAMRQWQTSSQNDVGGYFQVCGIHGAPHNYWDNAGNWERTGDGLWDTGFCMHSEQNFYLWHRPYLTLFEQQMRAVATSIANSWYAPQRATYQAAARTLRLPYWDWAKNAGGSVPPSISSQTITVANPTTGGSMTINNPLYSHTAVTGNSPIDTYRNGGGAIFIGTGNNRGTTWRASNYIRDMGANGPQLKGWTAQLLLTQNVCWNQFVTYDNGERSVCRNQPNVQSLEGIHNSVHNTVCGTMCNLDIAAFDPIFWLHHCNVDRIGALWQYLNPNTRIQPTALSSGNWVNNPGTVTDETWKMIPFRWGQGNTDWWEPRWAYDTRSVGYTYPEIADLPSIATLQNRVNSLYGNGRSQLAVAADSGRRMAKRSALGRRALLEFRQAVAGGASANLTAPPATEALLPLASQLINPDGSFNEYSATIKVDKSIAPGKSFNLHLFFGNVDKDRITHSDYLTAPNRLGGFAVSQSGNPMVMNTIAEGVVLINDGLLKMLMLGNIRSFKPDIIKRYAARKMTWRLVTSDGQDIGGRARSNDKISIEVIQTVVKPQSNNLAVPPLLSAPNAIIDTTNVTSAAPLGSGIAATTLTATSTGAAETGVGPAPLTKIAKANPTPA